MRVLHVASTLDRGGIAASIRHNLPHLVASPNMEAEAAVLYGESQHGEALAGQRIATHTLAMTSKYDPRGALRLHRLLRRGRYEVVHAHGWPPVLLVALVSLLAPAATYFLSEHSVTNRRRRWRLKPLDRFVYSRFQRVVAVSQAAAAALADWLPAVAARTTLIYNGLDPDRLPARSQARDGARAALGVADDQQVILCPGGLHAHKGVDVLLETLAALPGRGAWPEPLALIAGEGPEEAALKKKAKGLGLTERVRFLGFRPDLPALMAAADLLVIASRWEGCPMALLEAMAMELPVVATAVGGIPELVADGETGLLAPAERPEALAAAVERLIADPERRSAMGRAARRRLVAYFHACHSARQMAALYEQAV